MRISVGTFNLNNLFSRYNFVGELDAIQDRDTSLESAVEFQFTNTGTYRVRTFQGRLVRGKPDDERAEIIERIQRMNVDVLAVQEVEDIDTLNRFVRDELGDMYPHRVLVEGNDPRLIDLGVLSKFPIGAVTSWQHAIHPDDPESRVFGRDLLQVEILNPARTRRLLTVYNNHLKSHYVPFNVDQEIGARRANERRRRQAEMASWIIASRMRRNSPYIVLGDMNDPPESPWLAPLIDSRLALVNGLAEPSETRPAKADIPPPPGPAWTHRFKPSGQPAEYELYDQIWLSPTLAPRLAGAWIDRRTKHSGDGSDHDPAWIELDL